MEKVIGRICKYTGSYDPEIRGRHVVILALYRAQGDGFLRTDAEVGDVQLDDLFMVAALLPGKDGPEPSTVIFAAGVDEVEWTERYLDR